MSLHSQYRVADCDHFQRRMPCIDQGNPVLLTATISNDTCLMVGWIEPRPWMSHVGHLGRLLLGHGGGSRGKWARGAGWGLLGRSLRPRVRWARRWAVIGEEVLGSLGLGAVSLSSIRDEKDLQEALEAINKQHAKDFEKTCEDFTNWVSKQSLPVEAAMTTLTGAFRGAVMGVVVDVLFEGGCSAGSIQSPSQGGSIRPEVLTFVGGYKPLLQSFILGNTLEQARNFAVMTGVNAGISCVMKRLRGKEDMKTRMVSGFGSGVMVSLVSGMRGPSVMSIGVLFAAVNCAMLKLEEHASPQQAEDIAPDKTKGMFSSIGIGLGLDHYPMSFNRGLLTENTLPSQTDRNGMRKGGRKAWLRSS
ncbi:chloroplastic import inner membrane translocase subunit HP30-2-like protein [Tanacetum coccineum]|uniref:Chloroplastic import inner membrane translocase subunit HP30-2-like protein n=1 Tax=Tanacetum coccineum TaxID=301880 RepID=A0ABQ4WML6_9ASTR